jgi:hypothetical protein
MMKFYNAAVVAVAALAAVTATYTPPAHAATSASNAAGACQGNLPASDTNLRNRPLAIRNEGNANAFVSCSVVTPHNAATVNNAVIFMTNVTAAPIDVNCTFIDGGIAPSVVYHPKTVTLPANAMGGLVWTPAEFGLTTFSYYENFSCNLPPGVEMNVVGFDYTDTPPAP